MKILAITDIHGAYDAVEAIIEKENDSAVTVLGGDITGDGVLDERHLEMFRKRCPVVLGVAGNMDTISVDAILEKNGQSINGRGVIVDGVGFFGVSGVPFSPLHAPYEISEEEILQRAETGLKDVQKSLVKIFVPHAPPFNTPLDKMFLGKHVGSKSVRTFVERYQPDVVLCGHIHEGRGVVRMGKTQVINCGVAGKGFYGLVTLGSTVSVECRSVR